METRRAAVLMLALSLAVPALAQRPTEPDPEIPEQLKALRDAVVDRRMEFDGEAMRILEGLKEKHGQGMHERDERRVIDAVARVFVQGRLRDPDHTDLYVLAAEFLSGCGQPGARQLVRTYESSRFKSGEYAELRAELLVNMGLTKEPALIDMLLKESRISPDNEVRAAAGEALGYYTDSPLKTRRQIVKELLTSYGSVDNAVRNVRLVPGARGSAIPQDFTRENARETLRAIMAPWNRTLSQLTDHHFRQYPEWFQWHSHNPNWKRPDDGDGEGRDEEPEAGQLSRC